METKKRSLEELDVVFAAGGNPVRQEKQMPHGLSVEESRRILGLDEEPFDTAPYGLPKGTDSEVRFEQLREKA